MLYRFFGFSFLTTTFPHGSWTKILSQNGYSQLLYAQPLQLASATLIQLLYSQLRYSELLYFQLLYPQLLYSTYAILSYSMKCNLAMELACISSSWQFQLATALQKRAQPQSWAPCPSLTRADHWSINVYHLHDEYQ